MERALPYYNKAIEIFNSIDQKTYNQVLEIDSYIHKGYNFKCLKEIIKKADERIRSINNIFNFGEILESDEWNFDKTELNEILLNYYDALKIPFEYIYADFGTENENLKNWCTKWNKILEKAILIDSNNMNYWREKGIVLEFLMEDYEAIDCYKNALNIIPNDKETNTRLIELLIYCDEDEALKYCNNILKIYPSDISLLKLKLKVLKEYFMPEQNILEEKLECYDKLLQLGVKEIESYGQNEIIWKSRLETLISLNKHEEIIECCDKLLTKAHYSDDEKYWEMKINALSELERFEEAIECQKTGVEYLKTLNEEPKLYKRDNSYEKITSWEILLKYSNNKLKEYESNKLKEKQLEECDKLIKKEPNNRSYYLRKTVILRDLSRYKEAEASYKEYEKLINEKNKPKKRVMITCNNCGHKINSVAKKCPYCEYEFKICPKCKNQIDSNFKICPKCYHMFHD